MVVATIAQAQPLQCEIGGQAVNPANGNTTAGKTGLMRCRDSEGRMQREEELRDGKFVGMRTFHDRDGGKRTGNVNERGNRDGPQREYWPDGTLKREEIAADGETVGISRSFFRNGKPERISRSPEKGESRGTGATPSLEFNEAGYLTRISCSATNNLKEAEAPCGHAGRAETSLYSARGEVVARETYIVGRLIKRLTFRNGQPASQMEVSDTLRIEKTFHPDSANLRTERSVALDADGRARRLREGREREFAASGQLLREIEWRDGVAVREAEWYMNGSKRTEIERPRSAESGAATAGALATLREYWDNGRLRVEEQRQVGGGGVLGRLAGTRRVFRESGGLQSEAVFHPRGWRERQKDFDEAGKLVSEDEYFEDGSRKTRQP
jgi:antitoxin component YwqK of YwqJK toxin-antitoxin module